MASSGRRAVLLRKLLLDPSFHFSPGPRIDAEGLDELLRSGELKTVLPRLAPNQSQLFQGPDMQQRLRFG